MTLQHGLDEYYASSKNLNSGRGMSDPARDFSPVMIRHMSSSAAILPYPMKQLLRCGAFLGPMLAL